VLDQFQQKHYALSLLLTEHFSSLCHAAGHITEIGITPYHITVNEK
jgi:hypothetical protein